MSNEIKKFDLDYYLKKVLEESKKESISFGWEEICMMHDEMIRDNKEGVELHGDVLIYDYTASLNQIIEGEDERLSRLGWAVVHTVHDGPVYKRIKDKKVNQ